MASASTGFLPARHGFQFTNRFEYSKEFWLPFIGRVDLGEFVFGLCGGMCFTALDYFHSGRTIPSQTQIPRKGSTLRDYLEKRQIVSLIPPAGIYKVLEWTLRSDRDVGRLSAGRQFRMLRTRIDRGEPAVLALIRVREVEDATRNHQVIARAYSFDESSAKLEIELYDPNHPGKSPALSFDLTNPNQGIAPRQSTGEPLRGFFVIDYKMKAPPTGI